MEKNLTKKSRVQAYADERRDMEKNLIKVSPIYANMVEQLTKVYGSDGRKNGLDKLTKVLMAVGMAVHSGTESGIDWAITRALNHGGSPEQIYDAIDVALLNGGSFVVSNVRFAHLALEYRLKHMKASE